MTDKTQQLTTNNVTIEARTFYSKENSKPNQNVYNWGYEIKITNLRDYVVQLLNRHWVITDGMGKTEKVDGPGILGLQPIIHPGETITYNSHCQLKTPSGKMVGQYDMQTLKREIFQVKIPEMKLQFPASVVQFPKGD